MLAAFYSLLKYVHQDPDPRREALRYIESVLDHLPTYLNRESRGEPKVEIETLLDRFIASLEWTEDPAVREKTVVLISLRRFAAMLQCRRSLPGTRGGGAHPNGAHPPSGAPDADVAKRVAIFRWSEESREWDLKCWLDVEEQGAKA